MSGVEDKSIVPRALSPLAIPMMPIEELKKLTAYVNDVKRTLMKKDKDYVIEGNKQYTARSGFAKLAQGFNLSDDLPIITKLTYDETKTWKFYYYLNKKKVEGVATTDILGFEAIVVVRNPYGRQATGEGACTVEELHMTNNMSPKWYHRCLATAKTRAYNRAVSNFVGSADVSAEEMGLVYDTDEPERKQVDSEQTPANKPRGIPAFRSGAGDVVATISVNGLKAYLSEAIKSDQFSIDDFEVSELNGAFKIKNKKYIDYWHEVNEVIRGLGGEWIVDEQDKKKNHWWLPKADEEGEKPTPPAKKPVDKPSAVGVSSIEELEDILGRRVVGMDELITVTQDLQGFTIEPERTLDSEIVEVISYIVEGLGGSHREHQTGIGFSWLVPYKQGELE